MKNIIYIAICLVSMSGRAQQNFEVYFAHNSSAIDAKASESLDSWIIANHEADILRIEAFADTTGTDSYNIDLSKKRASAIMQRLVVNKMDRRFEINPVGEIAASAIDSLNRKVVIWYSMPEKPMMVVEKPVTQPKSELARQIKSAKKNDRLELKHVGFVEGTNKVRTDSEKALDDLVEILKTFPKLKIDIQGHICCSRSDLGELSLRRAKAVYEYLVKNGISRDRLSYQGFGGTKPLYTMPELSEEERQANRRVEIQITDL